MNTCVICESVDVIGEGTFYPFGDESRQWLDMSSPIKYKLCAACSKETTATRNLKIEQALIAQPVSEGQRRTTGIQKV